LFSALGLLPLACGGAFSGKEEEVEGGSGSGGSSQSGASSGGSSTAAGKPGTAGSSSSGGSSSGGSSSGGSSSGGSSSGGTAGSACEQVGNGYERCNGGPIHRPSVEQCASSLPRPVTKIAAPVDGQCASDADCVDMPHGYCTTGGQVPGTVCAYGCVKDSECGPGSICVCGDPVGHCVGSTCTSDAECGAGLRCQSYDSSHGCAIDRFACQTPQDTCSSDADCMGGFCDAGSGVFTCVMGGCAIGRPFVVEGSERVAPVQARRDWCDDCELPLAGLALDLRQRVASAWERIGQMEHASVAAFARFALQLLSLGAPPQLVEGATRAMADETRHARQAFGLASRYAGRALGPGPLDVQRSLDDASLLEIVRLVVREGCIGETAAALEAREAAEHAVDPRLAELLRAVAEDETRHAELAWRFVAWALEQSPGQVAEVVQRELRRGTPPSVALPELSASELVLLGHGVLPEALRLQVQIAARREVIAPCAAALLERATARLPDNRVLSA
jgi:hypothetical protein